MKLNKDSIKFKIPFYLFIFVTVMLLFLWISEILLLDTIYKKTKTDTIMEVGQYISENINHPNIEEYIEQIALRNDVCIAIFDHKGTPTYQMGCSQNEFTNPSRLFERMNDAYRNHGTYIEEVKKTEVLNTGFHFIPVKTYHELQYSHIVNQRVPYYIFMNSTITPLDDTVDTLKTILTITTLGMGFIAILLGLYISKKIITPIHALNQNAKKLGKEDIEFNVKGYQEIEELSTTLNQANQDLHQVEKLRNELISNISHDLKTPLTMIGGYAEMMRDLPDENNEENLTIIINETKYLTRLVNDVLDLSKLQAGAQKLDITTFDLTQMILDKIERTKSFCDVEFIYDTHIQVNADEIKISQVFYNILNNAIHYTKDKVFVRQIIQNNTVRIEISDNGEGIHENELDSIWECYYRSNNHKRQVSGSGLGLYICKQILDLHHARYGVTSIINQGSTFYFELDI